MFIHDTISQEQSLCKSLNETVSVLVVTVHKTESLCMLLCFGRLFQESVPILEPMASKYLSYCHSLRAQFHQKPGFSLTLDAKSFVATDQDILLGIFREDGFSPAACV
ncbi:hypothetical protein NPIL_52651 [Nephila pilipes]|uniref:Uncharacterized protein n=1 Tax=Nephila pilipes TaxID=299642 RepID=A0A8X6TRE2_NEPPI|nr:hypothetical protein NPIL_52651 [Nephila pilipes]